MKKPVSPSILPQSIIHLLNGLRLPPPALHLRPPPVPLLPLPRLPQPFPLHLPLLLALALNQYSAPF